LDPIRNQRGALPASPSGPRGLAWVRTPRQARSQETLDRILDAAEALVAEKGFEDTTISDIVARAGSSVGAFYTRFRDKEGLLYALYERYLAQATATARAALDPARWAEADVATILDATLRFLVAIFRQQAGLIRAFVLRNHVDPEFRARQERLSHYVSARLANLLLARADQIGHPDPERAAAFGFTMMFSTLESAILFGELRSDDLALGDEALASELTRAYLAYLGVAGAATETSTRMRPPRKEKPA
jgi:AcrR family transcriptional regulator